jgi:fumarate reductase flavoprotein subunit
VVDGISATTFSSNGIIVVITAALERSGVDIRVLQTKRAARGDMKRSLVTESVDIVVIGDGGSGLATGISASQNGSSVIILEKMPRTGGNTIISGAAYNAVDPERQKPQGIEDSADLHFTQTCEGGQNRVS